MTDGDLSFSKASENTIEVSSYLTRGEMAFIWFDLKNQPHVVWRITEHYRAGITTEMILSELAKI